ncbi:hypothetical protein H8959_013919 [Pygathrix nigripes]
MEVCSWEVFMDWAWKECPSLNKLDFIPWPHRTAWEFHQEFQPEPSLLGDSTNSGEERDQFTDRADGLHSEFMNYKARFSGSTTFFTHFLLFGTLQFMFKIANPSPSMSSLLHPV